ncbi:MAG TPA: acyl carrier protein [Gammaproteobacteria bacterium]|nr:acyl carrier protein [Gammaproteobacteria bacterium]
MASPQSLDDIQAAVFHALHLIAPEADLQTLNPQAPLREELDMDSMDFFRFMLQLNQALQIDIPEADYGQLSTLKSCLEYLSLKISKSLGLP